MKSCSKKRLLSLAVILILALSLAACSGSSLRFGAAGKGGTYDAFSRALAAASSREKEAALRVRNTAGSAANLRLLSQGYLQLAIAQADQAEDAVRGSGSFTGNTLSGFSAAAALFPEACHILVRADCGADSVAALKGKKVCLGEAESGTEACARRVLAACGLTDSLLTLTNADYKTALTQLREGKIDAYFCVIAPGSNLLDGIFKQGDIKLLSLKHEQIDILHTENPAYEAVVLPAGTYDGQTEDVMTLGTYALLLAADSLPAEQVRALVALLAQESDTLGLTLGITTISDPMYGLSALSVPIHPGAAAWSTGSTASPSDH